MSSMKCEECGVGRFWPVTVPYIRWLGQRPIVLPNAPAFKCDMCGKISFDPQFETAVQYLLDQAIADRQEASPRQPRPADRSVTWPPAGRSRQP